MLVKVKSYRAMVRSLLPFAIITHNNHHPWRVFAKPGLPISLAASDISANAAWRLAAARLGLEE